MARVKLYLDKRFQSENKTYYVKLRVTENRVSKYYPISHKKYSGDKTQIADDIQLDRTFTEKEFDRIMNARRRTDTEENYFKAFNSFVTKAETIIENMAVFTFDGFEKRYMVNRAANNSLIAIYTEKIKQLRLNEKYGTADNHQCAINSFREFRLHEKKKNDLKIIDVTPDFLNRYEKFMLKTGKSKTTVSMYTRTLRTIFNECIADGLVTADHYPFRAKRAENKRYRVPAVKNKKQAFTFDQITQLYFYKSANPALQKAVDFWKLSYLCNGMNFKDILSLKWKDIDGDYIVFERKKTESTKEDTEEVVVHIKDDARAIIRKYSTPSISPDNYLFPVISRGMDAETAHKKIKSFICNTNRRLKSVAKELGLPHFSTYSARHSFATTLKKNNASIELIKEALGHSSTATTENYLKSFDRETIKEATQAIVPQAI